MWTFRIFYFCMQRFSFLIWKKIHFFWVIEKDGCFPSTDFTILSFSSRVCTCIFAWNEDTVIFQIITAYVRRSVLQSVESSIGAILGGILNIIWMKWLQNDRPLFIFSINLTTILWSAYCISALYIHLCDGILSYFTFTL